MKHFFLIILLIFPFNFIKSSDQKQVSEQIIKYTFSEESLNIEEEKNNDCFELEINVLKSKVIYIIVSYTNPDPRRTPLDAAVTPKIWRFERLRSNGYVKIEIFYSFEKMRANDVLKLIENPEFGKKYVINIEN